MRAERAYHYYYMLATNSLRFLRAMQPVAGSLAKTKARMPDNVLIRASYKNDYRSSKVSLL